MSAEKNMDIAKITLGSPSTPLPVWVKKVDGGFSALGMLSSGGGVLTLPTLLADKSRSGAAQITSDADRLTVAEQVYGRMMRFYPTRSMMPHFLHELTERDPQRVNWKEHSFASAYMGAPSTGKTFMLKELGRMVHPRGAIYLNCKDVDMASVFCETIFDTSAADKEKAAIDARLFERNAHNGAEGLSERSVAILRARLGDAFVEEERGGKTVTSIDWNGIKVTGKTLEEQNYQANVLRETLRQVCAIERIALQGDMNQIGVTTRDGIAIRAADPLSADYGRPLILDEFNRSKPGTLQSLYDFVSFLTDGKVEQITVMGGQNKPFTFTRENLPVTYRVNFAGNPKAPGMGSDEIDRPLMSRFGAGLNMRIVADPTKEDFADRIGQVLTGTALLQTYYAAHGAFENNPKLLEKVLHRQLTMGLTDAEVRNIAPEALLNIKKPEAMIELAEQIADFMTGFRMTLKPDTLQTMLDKQAQNKAASSVPTLQISRAYEAYLDSLEIDLRTITPLFVQAERVSPAATDAEHVDFSAFLGGKQASVSAKVPSYEERLSTRGDRLEETLLTWIQAVVAPAHAETIGISKSETDAVLKVALAHAASCGIGKADLGDAKAGGKRPIRDIYNYDPAMEGDRRYDTLGMLISDIVRQRDATIPADIALVNPLEVRLAIEQAADSEAVDLEKYTKRLIVAADSSDVIDTPFRSVLTRDSVTLGETEEPPQLVSRDSFLTALAVPELRAKVLEGAWMGQDFLDLTAEKYAQDAALPAAQVVLGLPDQMAAGTEKNGFAVTSLLFGDADAYEGVHLLRAPVNGRTETIAVVMGLPPAMERLFAANGMRCVDGLKPDAAGEIDQFVTTALEGMPPEISRESFKDALTGAFLLRMNIEGQEGSTLGTLMTAPKAEFAAPVLVTALPARLAKKTSAPRGPQP